MPILGLGNGGAIVRSNYSVGQPLTITRAEAREAHANQSSSGEGSLPEVVMSDGAMERWSEEI